MHACEQCIAWSGRRRVDARSGGMGRGQGARSQVNGDWPGRRPPPLPTRLPSQPQHPPTRGYIHKARPRGRQAIQVLRHELGEQRWRRGRRKY